MRQRARVDDVIICYCEYTMDVNFSCVCQVFDNKFSQHCESSLQIRSAIASWIQSYLINVMTKFMINNRADTGKTDVNLLIDKHLAHQNE